MSVSTSSTPASAELRIVVGRIGRAHGLRGQVGVEPRTDEPDVRFAPGSTLFSAEGGSEFVVSAANWHSGRLLVTFEGVSDRTAAEAIRGTVLEVDVDPDVLPEDPESFYDHQLIGLTAVSGSGELLGEVSDVVHAPSQDLLVIDTPEGGEALVPFVAEIVPEVDMAGARVVITAPSGLFPDPHDAGEIPPPAAEAVDPADLR